MPTEKIKNLENRKMDDIIRSAIKEFSIHGYQEASYNRVIQNAKLSKGTMYYYFKSKEDLFLTIAHGTVHGLKSVLEPLPAPQSAEEFWHQAEDLAQRCLGFARAQPKIFMFVYRHLMPAEANLVGPSATLIRQTEAWLKDFCLKGQVLGAIRQDLGEERLHDVVWSLLGTLAQWINHKVENDSSPGVILDLLKRLLNPAAAALPLAAESP